MADPNEKQTNFKIEVWPDTVVSDGNNEVTVKCSFKDKKGKPLKEEIPVGFVCKKQKINEEKNVSHGSVSFKFRPGRPTGKTHFKVTSSLGEQSGTILIRPTPYQYIRDLFVSILMAVVIAFGVIRPFILQTYFIPSSSMEPTFYEKDRIIGLMFPYKFRNPRPGEIIIFRRPGIGVSHEIKLPFYTVKWLSPTNFIKRVIAAGGDTVEIRDLTVYVNDRPLKEPYLKQPPFYRMPPLKLPKGTLFMMGDNRNYSQDSHVWGPLELKNVRSKAWIQFWPFDRMKVVR